jgi:GNAT superfamily N-acetyltransferase
MLTIRPATADDGPELARLLSQLGHPTSAEDLAARWPAFAAEHVALVAVDAAGAVLGAMTLGQMRVLHRPQPVGRISALVVDESHRGQGVGRALVAHAEQRLRADGCGMLELTSRVDREDAHAFYEHLGFARTSVRLAKVLA